MNINYIFSNLLFSPKSDPKKIEPTIAYDGASETPTETYCSLYRPVKAIHPAGCDASHDVYTAAVIINL